MKLNIEHINKNQIIITTKSNKIMIDNFKGEEIICMQSKPKTYEEIKNVR